MSGVGSGPTPKPQERMFWYSQEKGDVGEKCYESVAYKSLTTLSRKAELTRGFDYDELLYTPATSKYGDGGHIHSKGAMQSTFTSVHEYPVCTESYEVLGSEEKLSLIRSQKCKSAQACSMNSQF